MNTKKQPRKLDPNSRIPNEELFELLKDNAPEIFAEGKIDPEKLKQTLGERVNINSERYGLNWAGKSDCFRHIQESTTATLVPVREESVDFDNTENIFIEGENLQVLKVLQKSYYGKIKMIYIDPPYNTGNDSFIYPDKFQESQDEYLQRIGDKDEEGNLTRDGFFHKNSKDGGHYHSNWLSMMYPRLFLARNLLRQDGVIFVSIDDNEVHNLKMIMNEVFGEENFRNAFIVRRYDKNLNKQFIDKGLKSFNTGFEYILCYSKSIEFNFNPVYKESSEERKTSGYWKGFWNAADRKTMRYKLLGVHPTQGQWKWKKERADKAVDNYIEYTENYSSQYTLEEYWEKTGSELEFIKRNPDGKGKNFGVEHWIAPSAGKLRTTNWTDLLASKSENEIKNLFDFPKNIEVVKTLIQSCESSNDIILDFFAGSGTTAHSVMDLNSKENKKRKFILVQLPEYCDEANDAYKEGYKNIAEIAKDRIRKVSKKIIGDGIDKGFKSFLTQESNFKIWKKDIKATDELVKQMEMFVDNVEGDKQGAILYELILKAGLGLNVKIETKETDYGNYYLLDRGKLAIFLDDELTEALIEITLKDKPEKFICLDKSFKNNDQLKTNTLLQMESAKVDFKVI
jgi:adenine-specific DNA-methyltransferase